MNILISYAETNNNRNIVFIRDNIKRTDYYFFP